MCVSSCIYVRRVSFLRFHVYFLCIQCMYVWMIWYSMYVRMYVRMCACMYLYECMNGYMDIWMYGYMDIWIYFVWIYGYMDIWIYRYMDILKYGYMDGLVCNAHKYVLYTRTHVYILRIYYMYVCIYVTSVLRSFIFIKAVSRGRRALVVQRCWSRALRVCTQ